MLFIHGSDYPTSQKISSKVLRILIITLSSELHFDDLVLFGKLMKFSTRISRRPSHLIKFWASEYPNTVGSSGRSQKSGSSCFDHNFLLRTPILMILDSMESL